MKKIKIFTIIVLVILITMVSFFGVYVHVQNRMENKVKEYELDMDLEGARYARLSVNTESTDVIKDADGNEVETEEELTDEQLAEKGYTKESVPNNSQESLIAENYQKSKEIVEERLKSQGVGEYEISLDNETGDILVQIPENDSTDNLVSNMNTVGKFEIIDADTKEVLMNNGDIKAVNVMYGSDSSAGGTMVYLNIEFNKEGKEKLKNISNTYVESDDTSTDNTTSENTTTDANTTNNESTENTTTNTEAENTTDNTTTNETTEGTTENTEESKESTKKEITMKVDDQEIMTTTFDEPIENGQLQLSIGSASTDTSTIQENIRQATQMASVLDSGNLPLQYDLKSNEYVLSDITNTEIEYMALAVGIVLLIGFIVLIIRFKLNGFLSAIAFIGLISLYLLVIRYTNVSVSLQGIVGIIVTILLNYIFISKILSKIKNSDDTRKLENVKQGVKEGYKEFFIKIVPICISIIALCFASWTTISSFGMVMFWGIVLMALYNYLITVTILKLKAEK